MEQSTTAAPYLPDELVVEILARLPGRSLCRSKCVSRRWRRLISDPAHSHRFCPCFFFFWTHYDHQQHWDFVTANGDGSLPMIDSALSFLPSSSWEKIEVLDSCNGLLLLRCSSAATDADPPPPPFYTVCNPATREWVALPQPSLEPGFDDFFTKACTAALGFDPSVSPHFHVFQLEEMEMCYYHYVRAVEIYSSETGEWVRKEAGWNNPREGPFSMNFHMTYFNGFLHLTTWEGVIAVVDATGQSWRTIKVPYNGQRGSGFVSHSQGRLIYMDIRTKKLGALVIYALEDYNGEWWTLKHKVSLAVLFGPGNGKFPLCHRFLVWNPIAGFHPTCHRFFFYDRSGTRLMSYDIKEGRVRVVVCTLEDVEKKSHPFFLYIPLWSGTLVRPPPDVSRSVSHRYNLTS